MDLKLVSNLLKSCTTCKMAFSESLLTGSWIMEAAEIFMFFFMGPPVSLHLHSPSFREFLIARFTASVQTSGWKVGQKGCPSSDLAPGHFYKFYTRIILLSSNCYKTSCFPLKHYSHSTLSINVSGSEIGAIASKQKKFHEKMID